jgi:glycogen phosphorylase
VAPRFYGSEHSDAAGAAGPSEPSRDPVPHQWIAMIKHTLATLGPAVSAERMVQDYVQQLYRPASASGRVARAEHFKAARELAAWVARVRHSWPEITVEHVDSLDVTDEPQIGDTVRINAYVRLADLTPEDVSVQAVHGQVTENDELGQVSIHELKLEEDLGDGRFLFSGGVTIDHSGSFGYTVRVLPRHQHLATEAELGLVTNAS